MKTVDFTRFDRLRDGLCMKIGAQVFDASRPEIRGVLSRVGPSMASVCTGPGIYRQVRVERLRKCKRSRQKLKAMTYLTHQTEGRT